MMTLPEKVYKSINEVKEGVKTLHVYYRDTETNFIAKNRIFENVDLKTWLPQQEKVLSEENLRIAELHYMENGKRIVLFED